MPRKVVLATQAELAAAGARKREADRLRQRRRRERLKQELLNGTAPPKPAAAKKPTPRRRATEAYNREYTDMLLRRAAAIRAHAAGLAGNALLQPPTEL